MENGNRNKKKGKNLFVEENVRRSCVLTVAAITSSGGA